MLKVNPKWKTVYGMNLERAEKATNKILKMNKDMVVTRYDKEKIYNKDGSITIKRVPYKTNLTRKINETAKIVKSDLGNQKLQELENFMEGNK